MSAAGYRKGILIAAACLMCLALPAFASDTATFPQTVDIPAEPAPLSASMIISTEKPLSIAELYERVRACRQSLLETRLDVVKEANEAKQRLDELLKNGKQGVQSAENLKKDLETVKEAQRILATILSDIISATTAEDAGAAGGVNTRAGLPLPGASAAGQSEIIPSREYLEGLILLYGEKTQQLTRIAESLNSIVPLI